MQSAWALSENHGVGGSIPSLATRNPEQITQIAKPGAAP
jgi:hypothetical protein